MCLISIQSIHKLQSKNEWMKAFPIDVHEALASSCLKGLAWEMSDRSHLGYERSRALPGRSRRDLGFGQTVTQVVLVASQFPDTDILVQDPPGFGAGWRWTLFR